MMELHMELIVFTLFVCLAAGTFAVQGTLAFRGKGEKIQLPALIVSSVSIGIGGMGSFLHLQHWERIFNGFGHLTSGITQEFIAIAVFVVALVICFVVMRRSDGGMPSAWVGIMAAAVSCVLVVVMAHSYSIAARPAWNTPLLWLYYLSNAALLGSLSVALIAGIKEDVSASSVARAAFFCGIASTAATFAYVAYLAIAGSAFTDVGSYFDPTHPTKTMAEPARAFSGIFIGENAVLFWLGAVVVGLVMPMALAFLARNRDPKQIATYTGIGLACVLIGGFCFRVILYVLGFSVFAFY